MNTEIENAEAVIARLEDKRKTLIDKKIELDAETQRISYDAHTGDAKAKHRLSAINNEISTHEREMNSVELALKEAQSRLAKANRNAATEADRELALRQRALADKFLELGNDAHEALVDAVGNLQEMADVHREMYQLGIRFPSNDQFRVLGARALQTALQETPWRKDLEISLLAPNQRQSFAALVAAWHATMMQDINRRIGDKQSEKAA